MTNNVDAARPSVNVQFLTAIFGEDWERATVTSFTGDPDNASFEAWGAHKAGTVQAGLLQSANNYFSLSLFRDPRSRRKAMFEGLYVVGVDDVGVKIDRLKLWAALGRPGFSIETSPGNEQWFYPLREPVRDMDEATSLQRLFGSDARDVTRYMRLPEGFNGKARVLRHVRRAEWSPGRTWTADEIRAAMVGVDVRTPQAMALAASQTGALAGPVLDPFGVSGVVDLTVGRALSHTDLERHIAAGLIGVGERDNALIAFHGHAAKSWKTGKCSEAEALEFMGRVNVRLTGGADKDFAGKWERVTDAEGLVRSLDAREYEHRNDEEALVLFEWPRQRASEDFAGAEVFDEEAVGDLAEDVAMSAARRALADLVFIESEARYWSRSRKVLFPRGDSSLAHTLASKLGAFLPVNTKGVVIGTVGKFLAERPDSQLRRVQGITTALGEPEFIQGDEGESLNIAPVIKPMAVPPRYATEGWQSIRPWLRMLVNVSGSGEMAGVVADWMAFMLCCPGVKPGWHVLVRGPEGVGKNAVLVPLQEALGDKLVAVIDGQTVVGRFNGYLTKRLVRIDELAQPGDGAKTLSALNDALKRITSKGSGSVGVERKGAEIIQVREKVGLWITSNHRVPLAISMADRRWLVLSVDKRVRAQASREGGLYWSKWMARCEFGDGAGCVAAWLRERWAEVVQDQTRLGRLVSAFAPGSDAKSALALAGQSELVGAVREACERTGPVVWPPAYSSEQMLNSLRTDAGHGLSARCKQSLGKKQVVAALEELGMVRYKEGRQVGQSSGSRLRDVWLVGPGFAARAGRLSESEVVGVCLGVSALRVAGVEAEGGADDEGMVNPF